MILITQDSTDCISRIAYGIHNYYYTLMLKLDCTQYRLLRRHVQFPFPFKTGATSDDVVSPFQKSNAVSRFSLSSTILNNAALEQWFSATSVVIFSQRCNCFHIKAERRNTMQTVENSACVSTVNPEGHTWFQAVGHIYPWEISGRERGSSALVQLTTHTAPPGTFPEPPPPSAMDAHQHGSPRATPSGAHSKSPRAREHTFLPVLYHTRDILSI